MATLTFIDDDFTIDSITPAQDVIDVAEGHGAPMIFGCGAGHCAVCMVVITQGAEHVNAVNDTERYTLTPIEIAQGIRLACQLRILHHGDVVLSEDF